MLRFFIKDYGIGFNMNESLNSNGINSIKSRMEFLNLEYKFESKPLEGTLLEFEIKIEK